MLSEKIEPMFILILFSILFSLFFTHLIDSIPKILRDAIPKSLRDLITKSLLDANWQKRFQNITSSK